MSSLRTGYDNCIRLFFGIQEAGLLELFFFGLQHYYYSFSGLVLGVGFGCPLMKDILLWAFLFCWICGYIGIGLILVVFNMPFLK